jgi:hypothetical protein
MDLYINQAYRGYQSSPTEEITFLTSNTGSISFSYLLYIYVESAKSIFCLPTICSQYFGVCATVLTTCSPNFSDPFTKR